MATKREMMERADDIKEALLRGEPASSFIPIIANKFNCSKSTIERQYRSIITLLANEQKEQLHQLRSELIMRSESLYRLAVERGNIRNAIDAINIQAKIAGLYLPEKEEKEAKEVAPIFQFKKVDNSNLSVVPDDDDEQTDT